MRSLGVISCRRWDESWAPSRWESTRRGDRTATQPVRSPCPYSSEAIALAWCSVNEPLI
jgi:hypothetical protein